MNSGEVESKFVEMNDIADELLSSLELGEVYTTKGDGLSLITQDQMKFALENISYELADILRKVRAARFQAERASLPEREGA